LDDGFGGNGAAAGAALLVEEVHDFAQGIGIGRIPEISAFAAYMDKANLFQLFQVMRKRGRGDSEFLLDLAGNHAFRMSGKEQAENLEAGLGTEGGEAVGGACNEERIGASHISMLAEIQNDVKCFLGVNAFPSAGILRGVPPRPWKRSLFRF
jgi:hypothetical protein